MGRLRTVLLACCLASLPATKADDAIALIVNSKAIGKQTLLAEWQRQRPYLPSNVSEALLWESFIEERIRLEMLRAIAQRNQMEVQAEEVEQALQSVAAQHQLPVEALLRKVQRETGLDAAAFRARLHDDVLAEKIKIAMLGDSVHISPEQVDEHIAQLAFEQGTHLHVEDLLLPLPPGDAAERAPRIQEQAQAVSEALERHQGDLRQVAAELPGARLHDLGRINILNTPPRFARLLANLPVGEVSPNPMIDQDGMHYLRVNRRESNAMDLQTTAVRLQHILIRGKDETAAQRAQQLQQALQQGASFMALAQRFSDDGDSLSSGGLLDWMPVEQFPPQLGAALEALPPQQIHLIETDYGWHLVLIHEKRRVNRSEALLRAQIEEQLYAQALDEKWREQLNLLRKRVFVERRL